MRGKNMTVRELIEKLKQYDKNSRVWVISEGRVERATEVYEGMITMNDDVIIK